MIRKTVTTLSIASAVIFSGMAFADDETKLTVYGSVRVMLEDVEGADGVEGKDALSRIGLKASQKVSDDLRAFGGVELRVNADETNSTPNLRLGYAGLKTNYGQVSFGSQTQVWHKFVRGSKFSDGSDSLRLGTIRDKDSLQYFHKLGKVKVGLSQSFENGGNEHTQIGAAIPFPKGKLGIAYTKDEEGGLLGLRPEVTFGKTSASLLYYRADSDFSAHGANLCNDGGDTTSAGIYGKQKFGKGMFVHARYMELDCDTDAKDKNSTKVEFVKQFNKKMRMWVSHENADNFNDETQLGVRYDF